MPSSGSTSPFSRWRRRFEKPLAVSRTRCSPALRCNFVDCTRVFYGVTENLRETQMNSSHFPLSILVLDDSDEDRFVVRRLLAGRLSAGLFAITEAATGERGLAVCRNRPPDCILLDHGLGDTDSIAFLEELNAGRDPDDPLCPTVLLTGGGTGAPVAVSALKGWAQDYLIKEALTADAVARAIENAIEKVRLRRELRAAEARFRSSLDYMRDSFGIYAAVRDLESNRIGEFRCEYVNDAARAGTGFTRDEQVGQILVARIFPDYAANGLFDEYVRVVETGNPLEKAAFVCRDPASGDTGEFSNRAYDIRAWKMGDGFAAAWRDVTDRERAEERRRAAEEALRATKDRLELAQEAARFGTWDWRVSRDRTACSAHFFELHGLPVNEEMTLAVREWLKLIHASDQGRVVRNISDVLHESHGGGEYSEKYRILFPDGVMHWLESRGKVYRDGLGRASRMVGVTFDVTALREAELRLATAARTLAYHVENTPLANIEWDGDFRVRAWSGQAHAIFGWTASEVLGKRPDEFFAVHRDDADRMDDMMRDLLDGTKDHGVSLGRTLRRDGQAIWCEWYNSAEHGPDGRPASILSLVLDVTEREEARLRMHADLAREHDIAKALQSALLIRPPGDAFPGLEFGTVYRPAGRQAEVGGDFYDVFTLDDGRVALVVGDISGKGMAAARYLAEIKFSLRAYLRRTASTSAALGYLNADLCRLFAEPTPTYDPYAPGFVCLSLALIDIASGALEVALAGAEPPLLLRARSGAAEELMGTGSPPLGAYEEATFVTTTYGLRPGDLLVQHTDGVTEVRRNAQGTEFLNHEGLVRLVREALPLRDLSRIGEYVLKGAEVFGGGGLRDDACLLLARWDGPPDQRNDSSPQ